MILAANVKLWPRKLAWVEKCEESEAFYITAVLLSMKEVD